MPRISSKLLRLLYAEQPALAQLARALRNVQSARNELRWIQSELQPENWAHAVKLRLRHVPLQYILGTQPFGPLDIKCRPGVLIPRWETEEWVSLLADKLRLHHNALSVLDACTGTGCIPLLLKSKGAAVVHGFDVSPVAVALATENAVLAGLEVSFSRDDVMAISSVPVVDVVTSNPPYIPLNDYRKPYRRDGVDKSVRRYEPRLALVGDLEFYQALVHNVVIPSKCRAFVFEVGYESQAKYTASLLPAGWLWGIYRDSGGRVRCVVGWREAVGDLRSMVEENGLAVSFCK